MTHCSRTLVAELSQWGDLPNPGDQHDQSVYGLPWLAFYCLALVCDHAVARHGPTTSDTQCVDPPCSALPKIWQITSLQCSMGPQDKNLPLHWLKRPERPPQLAASFIRGKRAMVSYVGPDGRRRTFTPTWEMWCSTSAKIARRYVQCSTGAEADTARVKRVVGLNTYNCT